MSGGPASPGHLAPDEIAALRADALSALGRLRRKYPASRVRICSDGAAEAPCAEPGGRPPWPAGFPDVIVHQPYGSPLRSRNHPDFAAAKGGDVDAADRLVQALLDWTAMERLGAALAGQDAIAVWVHAEEATGRNKIPLVYAWRLAERFDLPLDPRIAQAVRAFRTGTGGRYRLLTPVAFAGPALTGHNYLLIDDHAAQGGTLADLRAHIEAAGGRVVAATTLTAGRNSEKLAVDTEIVAQLRERHAELEALLRHLKGSAFPGLTHSEATYLLRYPGSLVL